MTMSADELLAALSQFAETSFEDEGVVAPMFHAVTEDGEQMIYMTPWSDEKSKAMMLQALRKQFSERRVVRYGVVSEVWLAGYDGPASAPVAVMPRDRPDRQEAVVIAIIAPPQVVVARRDIVRPWDGSAAHLGPLVTQGMEGLVQGAMLELIR